MESEEIELWKEHPNQMFIGTILKSAIAWVAAILLILASGMAFEDSWITVLLIFAGPIVAIYYTVMAYVGAWNMLKFKNRSPWWIWLMLLIGLIGAAILLCLENKSYHTNTMSLSNA